MLVTAIVFREVYGAGRGLHDKLQAPGPAPAPAPGPVAAPAGAPASVEYAPAPAAEYPSLEALHITFEIKNFNYFDLTKETCPKKVKVPKAHAKQPAPKAAKVAAKKAKEAHGLAPLDKQLSKMDKSMGNAKADDLDPNMTQAEEAQADFAKGAKDAVEDFGEAVTPDKQEKLPWMKDKKKADSLIQMGLGACAALPDLTEASSPEECTTVMVVLRRAIKETVRGILKCMFENSLSSPAPAAPPPNPDAHLPVLQLPSAPAGAVGLVPLPIQGPAPAPAFLAPVPAPSPMPVAGIFPDIKIFVTFRPGREMEGGRSTIVEIAFIDAPGTGINDIGIAEPLLNKAVESGVFKTEVKQALHKVTGIKPKLRKIELKMKEVEQWHVDKCEGHLKALVSQFSLHYTREQVPLALYNECTNFMTKMSFSADHIMDPMDTVRCRRATKKFTKKWKFGKNAEDGDFADMCVEACEAKFGRGALRCNVVEGDHLLNQPL